MRRAVVLAALLATGCGSTGTTLPEGADASYTRWRDGVGLVCQRLRERVEELPNPNSEVGEGSDEEQLQQLADAARPIAALYVRAARENRDVALPAKRADFARDYVARFEDRARNYAEIARVAAAGDREEIERLTARDETLSKQLAFATEQARVRC